MSKIKIAYDINNPGILPVDFSPSYVSGSTAYGTYDDTNPNLSAINYWRVDEYEYAVEPDRIFYSAIEAGYDTGNGYRLALGDKDRSQFTSMLTLYSEAERLGQANGATMVSIADMESVLHPMTLTQLRVMLLQYGMFYQTIWSNYKTSLA